MSVTRFALIVLAAVAVCPAAPPARAVDRERAPMVIHVSPDGCEISGFSYTPQDGNSLLSSVAAAVWGLYPETYEKIIQCLKPYFFQEV